MSMASRWTGRLRPAETTLVLLMLAAPAVAQTTADSTATVRVTSNLSGATVRLDSVEVGRLPQTLTLAPGVTHRITVAAPAADRWGQPSQRWTLTLPARTDTTVDARFAYIYTVETTPFGAEVTTSADSAVSLGTTPLRLTRRTPLVGSMTVRLGGYETRTMPWPAPDATGAVTIREPLRGAADATRAVSAVPWRAPASHINRGWIYTAAAMTVATGVSAAVFKLRADARYDEHLATGDPTALDATHRADRFATGSIVGMELSFATLAFLLLRD